MIIGIDPGQSGGAAMLNEDGGWRGGIRMPILLHGKRKLVNPRVLSDLVGPAHKISAIVLEQVNAYPGQGSVSGFNFGRHTGSVETWALSMGCPVHWFTPAVWKKAMGLSKDKRASLDKARLEFGEHDRWTVGLNDGIAEAGLIALHYQRTR